MSSGILRFAALLVLASASVSIYQLFDVGETSDIQQQLVNLQKKQTALTAKLAKTEALLSLRDAQIKSMTAELQRDKSERQRMQQRLDLFDQVLAERKVAGIHFLRPSASWQERRSIAYQLILVKGNNYPRWIIGHLTFTALDSKGHSISLTPAQTARSGFKIEMTEQTFIEGALPWRQPWQAETLRITLIDHRGRNKGSIEIPIEPSRQAATEQPS